MLGRPGRQEWMSILSRNVHPFAERNRDPLTVECLNIKTKQATLSVDALQDSTKMEHATYEMDTKRDLYTGTVGLII